jgi:SAM-dependent methyltransferase
MRYAALRRLLPSLLLRHILYFERRIEESVAAFAGSLAPGARVLDAGAGECRHAPQFARQRYYAVDLAVGDPGWDYSRLDCLADLAALPFLDGAFDACLNVVTLEHVREPAAVLRELARMLKPGGRLLLVVPHAWEIHQAPHDYYRYTRYGAAHLISLAGLEPLGIEAIGGYFRFLSRQLLNGLQFFGGVWFAVAALFLAPPALLVPLFDWLDRERIFTLGYICTARKPS